MAKAQLVLQALTQRSHLVAINEMLALQDPVACLFSVAFARSAGVASLAASISSLKIRPKIFVGVRNDITSIQAIRKLLVLDTEVYAVDTGARRPIFHPKLYIISGCNQARAVIGSANLTHYGLQNNIEVSTLLDLDLKQPEDKRFVDEIFESFENLTASHPKHVRLIGTADEAEALFNQGLLCDEDIIIAPSVVQHAPKVGIVEITPMALFRGQPKKKSKRITGQTDSVVKPVTRPTSPTQFVRVWRSKPLVARDLNVPDAANTARTGSIGLTQDADKDFDFQTRFRNNIFAELDWKPRAKCRSRKMP